VGCAHSSIIGFISTQWLKQSADHSILDGAPSPEIGKGRRGQKNSDILLCSNEKPIIVVEVETSVSSYEKKLKTIYKYLNNSDSFKGLEFGLLFMSNLCSGERKYKHNWDSIKGNVREHKKNIILISVEKQKSEFMNKDSILGKLRCRNDYYPWNISKIDYWIHASYGDIREGILFAK